MEYDPETVIQREIYLDGKNICRVNGSLVSVSILRKLGIQLINIHGQHDSASLFDEENHLAFLDAFADNRSLRESYSQAYQKVTELRREIDSLTMTKVRNSAVWRPEISDWGDREGTAGTGGG